MDRQPHAPLTPCTLMAPTGSSTPILSKKNTASTTKLPGISPMMAAPPALTNAQGAVIATRPASMPLHIMDGSGFLVRNHHIHSVAANAPVAEASIVLTATTPMRRSVAARLEPGLNPNQPNARMNVPTMHIGILCGGMKFVLPSLLNLP